MGVQIPSLTLFFMKNLFSRLQRAFSRTRENLSLLESQNFSWEDAEEALISADFGISFAEEFLNSLKKEYGQSPLGLKSILKAKIKELLSSIPPKEIPRGVILITGVNGSGKTTTAAKLALFLKDRGKVLLVAADTFRAAAQEQLEKLASSVGVDFFPAKGYSDPAAVAFDAAKKPYDYIIVDTAGRLHTKENLMKEAAKIKNSVIKASGNSPFTLLVLDGTIGQNSITQAEEFSRLLDIDGLVITKLDGTSRGGAIVPIVRNLKIPVLFVGIGEGMEDLVPFEPSSFVEALFG